MTLLMLVYNFLFVLYIVPIVSLNGINMTSRKVKDPKSDITPEIGITTCSKATEATAGEPSIDIGNTVQTLGIADKDINAHTQVANVLNDCGDPKEVGEMSDQIENRHRADHTQLSPLKKVRQTYIPIRHPNLGHASFLDDEPGVTLISSSNMSQISAQDWSDRNKKRNRCTDTGNDSCKNSVYGNRGHTILDELQRLNGDLFKTPFDKYAAASWFDAVESYFDALDIESSKAKHAFIKGRLPTDIMSELRHEMPVKGDAHPYENLKCLILNRYQTPLDRATMTVDQLAQLKDKRLHPRKVLELVMNTVGHTRETLGHNKAIEDKVKSLFASCLYDELKIKVQLIEEHLDIEQLVSAACRFYERENPMFGVNSLMAMEPNAQKQSQKRSTALSPNSMMLRIEKSIGDGIAKALRESLQQQKSHSLHRRNKSHNYDWNKSLYQRRDCCLIHRLHANEAWFCSNPRTCPMAEVTQQRKNYNEKDEERFYE